MALDTPEKIKKAIDDNKVIDLGKPINKKDRLIIKFNVNTEACIYENTNPKEKNIYEDDYFKFEITDLIKLDSEGILPLGDIEIYNDEAKKYLEENGIGEWKLLHEDGKSYIRFHYFKEFLDQKANSVPSQLIEIDAEFDKKESEVEISQEMYFGGVRVNVKFEPFKNKRDIDVYKEQDVYSSGDEHNFESCHDSESRPYIKDGYMYYKIRVKARKSNTIDLEDLVLTDYFPTNNAKDIEIYKCSENLNRDNIKEVEFASLSDVVKENIHEKYNNKNNIAVNKSWNLGNFYPGKEVTIWVKAKINKDKMTEDVKRTKEKNYMTYAKLEEGVNGRFIENESFAKSKYMASPSEASSVRALVENKIKISKDNYDFDYKTKTARYKIRITAPSDNKYTMYNTPIYDYFTTNKKYIESVSIDEEATKNENNGEIIYSNFKANETDSSRWDAIIKELKPGDVKYIIATAKIKPSAWRCNTEIYITNYAYIAEGEYSGFAANDVDSDYAYRYKYITNYEIHKSNSKINDGNDGYKFTVSINEFTDQLPPDEQKIASERDLFVTDTLGSTTSQYLKYKDRGDGKCEAKVLVYEIYIDDEGKPAKKLVEESSFTFDSSETSFTYPIPDKYKGKPYEIDLIYDTEFYKDVIGNDLHVQNTASYLEYNSGNSITKKAEAGIEKYLMYCPDRDNAKWETKIRTTVNENTYCSDYVNDMTYLWFTEEDIEGIKLIQKEEGKEDIVLKRNEDYEIYYELSDIEKLEKKYKNAKNGLESFKKIKIEDSHISGFIIEFKREIKVKKDKNKKAINPIYIYANTHVKENEDKVYKRYQNFTVLESFIKINGELRSGAYDKSEDIFIRSGYKEIRKALYKTDDYPDGMDKNDILWKVRLNEHGFIRNADGKYAYNRKGFNNSDVSGCTNDGNNTCITEFDYTFYEKIPANQQFISAKYNDIGSTSSKVSMDNTKYSRGSNAKDVKVYVDSKYENMSAAPGEEYLIVPITVKGLKHYEATKNNSYNSHDPWNYENERVWVDICIRTRIRDEEYLKGNVKIDEDGNLKPYVFNNEAGLISPVNLDEEKYEKYWSEAATPQITYEPLSKRMIGKLKGKTAEYQIDFNEGAYDLNVSSDSVELIDESASGTLDGRKMSLLDIMLSSVKVFDCDKGEKELDSSKYSVSKSATDKNIVIFNLPDKKHLLIRYKAKVKANYGDNVSFVNYAYFRGYRNVSHIKPGKEQELVRVKGESGKTREIQIVKINDNGQPLDNTKFTLEAYKNGEFIDAFSGDKNNIKLDYYKGVYHYTGVEAGVLYRIKEIEAKNGQYLDDEYRYMVIYDDISYMKDDVYLEGGKLKKIELPKDFILQEDQKYVAPFAEVEIINPDIHDVSFKKECDGENLEGVDLQLEIYDTELEKYKLFKTYKGHRDFEDAVWTTDGNIKTLGLIDGVYRVVEKKARAGYCSIDPVKFKLTKGELSLIDNTDKYGRETAYIDNDKLVIRNYKTEIKFAKIDDRYLDDFKYLDGASFKLSELDESKITVNGKTFFGDTWISNASNLHNLSGLETEHMYKLSEEKAPDNYNGRDDISFKLDKYGSIKEINGRDAKSFIESDENKASSDWGFIIKPGKGQDTIFIMNEYVASGSDVIRFTKQVLKGDSGKSRDPESRENFSFSIIDESGYLFGTIASDNNTRKNITISSNNKDLSFKLDYDYLKNIRPEDLNKLGFKYKIKEIDTGKPGFTYDKSEYTLLATVSDAGKGNLDIEKSILKDGKAVDKIEFINQYIATGSDIENISAYKYLDDEIPSDEFKEQFEFEIKESFNGKTIRYENVKNIANLIDLPMINNRVYTYPDDIGTHVFEIKESDINESKYIKDETIYRLIVKVSDENHNGILDVQTSLEKDGSIIVAEAAIGENIIFNNKTRKSHGGGSGGSGGGSGGSGGGKPPYPIIPKTDVPDNIVNPDDGNIDTGVYSEEDTVGNKYSKKTKTSDESDIMRYATIIIMAIAGIIALLKKKLKEDDK